MKSGARYPLTKKQEGGGEDLSRPVQFFLPSLPGVYGWVTSITIFGGRTVGEVNWLCRKAGRVNKQSTYLDICGIGPFKKTELLPLDTSNFNFKIGKKIFLKPRRLNLFIVKQTAMTTTMTTIKSKKRFDQFTFF